MYMPIQQSSAAKTAFQGVVRRFNNVGGYGFAWSEELKAEVFFHTDDRDPRPDKCPGRQPVIGDIIAFKLVPSQPNQRAQPGRFDSAPALPHPVERVVRLVTHDEQVFFYSQWMTQWVRLEVELDWVRRRQTILRAECTCRIALATLERVGAWNKTTLAVYKMAHIDGCALHLRGAPTHFVGFRFSGVRILQHTEQVELIGVQMSEESPWHRLRF